MVLWTKYKKCTISYRPSNQKMHLRNHTQRKQEKEMEQHILPISWDGVNVKIMSMSINLPTSCKCGIFHVHNLVMQNTCMITFILSRSNAIVEKNKKKKTNSFTEILFSNLGMLVLWWWHALFHLVCPFWMMAIGNRWLVLSSHETFFSQKCILGAHKGRRVHFFYFLCLTFLNLAPKPKTNVTLWWLKKLLALNCVYCT